MALRAGYKGFKKLISPLILNRPGTIEIDGDALNAELNEVFFPRSEQDYLGAKNLLIYPFHNTTKTNRGITFTDNGDGTITISGTNDGTGVSSFYFATENTSGMREYLLSIGREVTLSGSPGESIVLSANNYDGSSHNALDEGNGVSFKFTNSSAGFRFDIDVAKDTALAEPVTIYPMLRLATDPDNTYAPYSLTNIELTGKVKTLEGSASDQKTAINAIIAAATEAADFAAFKTAMGAITPVTRSAAPEATREVIEEEPVTTKKTTRKKSTATADEEKEGDK